MNPKLTYSGQEAMLKALNGDEICFTKIKLGNGPKPDDYAQLTDLQNPLKSISIEQAVIENHYAKLTGETVSNADFESDFYWTELGIFVSDPEGGPDDLLYAYAHYELSEDAAPLYIGASTSSVVQITPIVHVYIGDAENITAELSEASDYALKSELNAHKSDSTNPHGVTKAQVGLSNVPNVTTNNQTPTFSIASALAEINSGEKMSTIMGKVKKAINSLISHIGNKNNPHSVTLSQVGAAAASHTHSAAAITSGTLGVGRGGTGVTSKSDLAVVVRDNLRAVYSTRAISLKRLNGTEIATGSAYLWKIGPIRHVRIAIDITGITYSAGELMKLVGLGDYVKNGVHYCLFFPAQGADRPEYITGWVDTAGEMSLTFPPSSGKSRGWIVSETAYIIS